MNTLHTRPGFIPIPPKQNRLDGKLIYENKKYIIKIFENYTTNGGSISRLFHTILGVTPFDPRCIYAFFLHDWLYGSHLIPRAEADAIMLEVLEIPPSCNRAQRTIIYYAVKMFGWIPYWMASDEEIDYAQWHGEIIYKA